MAKGQKEKNNINSSEIVITRWLTCYNMNIQSTWNQQKTMLSTYVL